MGFNQRTFSIVLLTILTALPVSGTLCAVLCDSAAKPRASAHHGSGTHCEEPGAPSAGAQIEGAAEQDCSTHDAAIRQAAGIVAGRSDGITRTVLLTTATDRAMGTAPSRVDSSVDSDAPPRAAPPSKTPLVLRV